MLRMSAILWLARLAAVQPRIMTGCYRNPALETVAGFSMRQCAADLGRDALQPQHRTGSQMALTAKQGRFVAEYLIDLNATQAAIRAGYSEKTAEQQGSRLLSNAKVASAIAEAQSKRSKRTEITQDRVLAELAKIGFSDLRRALNEHGNLKGPQDWDDDTAGAIASIEVVTRSVGVNSDGEREIESIAKIKTWDKLGALEKLGKHLGMFSGDAPQVTVNLPFTGFMVERAAKPDTPDTD